MKKAKLIYNPAAGTGIFKNMLDDLIRHLQKIDMYIVPHRLDGKIDVQNAVKDMVTENYELLILCGGDGTVNMIVNEILKNNIQIPLVIFPTGTSNDFARYLGCSNKIDDMVEIITKNNVQTMDVGKVNELYFINVLAAGFISDVAHEVDSKFKNILGMLAYYIKGLEKLPSYKYFDIEMDIDGQIFKESILLLLVLNTTSAGGFNNLAPAAKIDDGLLDVVILKACPLQDLLSSLMKIIKGRHIDDDNVLYLQGKSIKIECSSNVESDIDGEKGPRFPLHIVNNPSKIKVLRK